MTYLVSIATVVLLVGTYYRLIGRLRTTRRTAALVVGTLAVIPVLDGGVLLIQEIARKQKGRVTAGVVVRKLVAPWTGEPRRDRGRRRRTSSRDDADVAASHRFELYGGIARLLATGSPDAWIVMYRYPCGRSSRCWQHEAVSRELWSALRV